MNLNDVNRKVNQLAKSSQPSIAGWLNKLSKPQPIRLGKRKIGACVANSDDKNKQQKVSEALVEFENKIREENIKFNKSAPKLKTDDQTIRIKSSNVNSVISLQKMNKIPDLMNDNPDILALNDTRVKEYRLARFRSKDREVFATNTDTRGVAIIAKRTLNPEMFECDEEGGFVAITFDSVGKKHGLTAIYGPNDDDIKFWSEKINNIVAKMKDEGIKNQIICGDLNIPLGRQIGYVGNKTKKKEALLNLMDNNNITHAANNQLDTNITNAYSFWRRKQERNINQGVDSYQASILDHFLTTLPQNETSVKYLRSFLSDHAAIVELKIKTSSRSGKTSWKLNPSAIDDEKVRERITKICNKLTKSLMKRISQIEMSSLP